MQHRGFTFRSRLRARSSPFILAAVVLAGLALLIPRSGRAADPASANLAPTGTSVSWNGTAVGTGATGEGDASEGTSGDTFTLNITGTESDWQGKYVDIKIAWLLPVNDYDLYVHKGSNSGPLVGSSGAGAPATDEETAIVPADTGVGTYTVHIVYFANTPGLDQPHGTATIRPLPPTGTAQYLKGGMEFSASGTVKCPTSEADGEPSSRCDAYGNYYITGIRGVPAGCDLWYYDLRPDSPTYDPNMRNPIYRGQPDSFTESESTSVGADGGGDVDISVGNGNGPNGLPTLAFTSLVLSNIYTARSYDGGRTWSRNHAGNVTGGAAVDDRQWIEFWGKDKVYLLYRTFDPAVTQIQLSKDGGLTYGPARTAGLIGQVGGIDVDQNDGTVYICGTTGQVGIGHPDPILQEPTQYTVVQVGNDPTGVGNLFPIIKVAKDGTVYYCYSNSRQIMLQYSKDKGLTWSLPVRVSDGVDNRCCLLPHMETGDQPGSVGITWYGTSGQLDDDNADWNVFYAVCLNATGRIPTFRQSKVSDHVIHGSNISLGGTFGNANRNLLDYFQVCFDPVGAAVIGFTDDHNDFSGHTFTTRQLSGSSMKGGKIKKAREGASLPPPPSPPADGSQVTDFPNDVAYGLLGVIDHPDPMDILSIKYSTEDGPLGKYIVATMKVSDLSTLPPLTNWRMSFTANAPGAGLSTNGGYSLANSDRGDMFYVRAFSRADQTYGFVWGTATRNGDGGQTYTDRGNADFGGFDQAHNTITLKVAVAKLNLYVTHGLPIASGSVIAGLRGLTYTSGESIIKRDATRGGSQFTIG